MGYEDSIKEYLKLYKYWNSQSISYKCMPTPLDHSDEYLIVESLFLMEGNYLLSARLELGCQTFSQFKEYLRRALDQLS